LKTNGEILTDQSKPPPGWEFTDGSVNVRPIHEFCSLEEAWKFYEDLIADAVAEERARANELVEIHDWAAKQLAPLLGVYADHGEPFDIEADTVVWQTFVDCAKKLRDRLEDAEAKLEVARLVLAKREPAPVTYTTTGSPKSSVASFPAIPVDPEDEAKVEELIKKKREQERGERLVPRRAVICDGCNVRGVHLHRCCGENAMVRGELTGRPCECKSCNPTEEELAEFRANLERELAEEREP